MEIEIERKFLVKGDFKPYAERVRSIKQGYVAANNNGLAVRVRIYDGREAILELKKGDYNDKITQREYAYDIPVNEAVELLAMGPADSAPVEKERYYVPAGKHTWEVDVFHGANEGLVVAEIELLHADEDFERPEWLGKEVTSELRYKNVMLAEIPYYMWKDLEEA
ncbi:MAG: CYTH domain-containing protein [Tannerellaceae bacterium]|jgi:CYTH domain-containing protein|nr:CYTH domain-containing protein [Tannerellaceae bacterium]